MKYLSLFSGIGSPEQALKNLGIEFELFGFSEIDKYSIKSYCAVHGVDESLNLGDITKIDIEGLPTDIELITHGSPCQDFSVAGKGKGADEGTGTRSSLMWNTVAICEHCNPKYVIWENVKNVLSKKHRHNFDKYLAEMDRIGYQNFYQVLNAKNYGVPQNRERVFVISIRKDLDKQFEFPKGFDNGIRLKHLLEDWVESKYYVNTDRAKNLIKQLKEKDMIEGYYTPCDNSICKPKSIEIANCINANYNTGIQNRQSIGVAVVVQDSLKPKQIIDDRYYLKDIQKFFIKNSFDMESKGNGFRFEPHIKENAEISKCVTTRAGGRMDDNFILYSSGDIPDSKFRFDTTNPYINTKVLDIESNLKIRKLTPKECWRLMGFKDEQFHKAEKVCSNSQLYKQAGNSIVVNVMEEIFKSLI